MRTKAGYPYTDARVSQALAFLQDLNRQGRPLTMREYHTFNTEGLAPDLGEINRLFGSWEDFLEAAKKPKEVKQDRGRIPEERLIEAMQHVATQLGVKSISSSAYDRYYDKHPEEKLPSSSVIRKHLGKTWDNAQKRAGMAPASKEQDLPDRTMILRVLRRAQRSYKQPLTQKLYKELRNERIRQGDAKESWPEIDDILRVFLSWESATREADIEIMDDLMPGTYWTIGEARRHIRAAQAFIKGPVTKSSYNHIKGLARRPMPSWEELSLLLHLSQQPDVDAK